MIKSRCLILLISGIIFSSCNDQDSKNTNENNARDKDFKKRGDSLVRITFDTLRNTLVRTMAEAGPRGAVGFCNVNALRLTGTYTSGDASIGRVTDRVRNPGNELSDLDKVQFEKYKEMMAKKDSLPAIVISQNSDIHYYKPILIQTMCLNCHGVPGKEISPELLTTIDSLYPGDRAKGYKAGELRGMWHIVFNQKN